MTLFLTYLLNLFDLFMTTLWVNRYGIHTEITPFGRFLINSGLAVLYKVIIVGAALATLHICIKHKPKWAWTGWLVLSVYAVLACYHLLIAWAII